MEFLSVDVAMRFADRTDVVNKGTCHRDIGRCHGYSVLGDKAVATCILKTHLTFNCLMIVVLIILLKWSPGRIIVSHHCIFVSGGNIPFPRCCRSADKVRQLATNAAQEKRLNMHRTQTEHAS